MALETDSVSGRGLSPRLGAGKVRHVDTLCLLVQGVFHRREATVRKIPGIIKEADRMTRRKENLCAKRELPLH